MAGGLSLRDVSFAYGGLVVLDDATHDVASGGALVVTGDNGVGKSTFLYVAAGLLAATSGTVTLDGHRPDVLHPSALFRAGVRRGFVFQQGGLLANLPVLANVALPLRYHADVLGLDEDGAITKARAALESVDIEPADFLALPAHLSLGVKKRVAIARALALGPNFLFFDDPDAGLDTESAAIVAEILTRCRDDASITLFVATNHRVLIDRLGVSPYELAGGKLLRRASRQVA